MTQLVTAIRRAVIILARFGVVPMLVLAAGGVAHRVALTERFRAFIRSLLPAARAVPAYG